MSRTPTASTRSARISGGRRISAPCGITGTWPPSKPSWQSNTPPGTLARLVGWEANWVLDDPSDAGAARFLTDLAEMLREVIGEVER
nr:hypothetical protein GCM10020092_096440 [Actinoplanes digitatis]